MNIQVPKTVEGSLLVIAGALAAYLAVFGVQDSFWLVGFPSGFFIPMLLSYWKPRAWLWIGLGVPSLTMLHMLWLLPESGPTAWSLAAAVLLFWALLSFAGAAIGRSMGRRPPAVQS